VEIFIQTGIWHSRCVEAGAFIANLDHHFAWPNEAANLNPLVRVVGAAVLNRIGSNLQQGQPDGKNVQGRVIKGPHQVPDRRGNRVCLGDTDYLKTYHLAAVFIDLA
jgi:hypothetical protein